MKSVLCLICLLPLVCCAPQRGIREQKRMQILGQSQVVQAMGASMAHQLDSLFQGAGPNVGYGKPPGAMFGYTEVGPRYTFGPFNTIPGITSGPSKPISAQTPTTNNVDIVLVLDSSGSVGNDAFVNGKMAAKTIIQYINSKSPISTTGSRVGLIKFSSTALTSIVFHIGSNNYLWDVIDAIDRVTYDSGPATATAEALRQAKLEIERNSIQNNMKLVWVVTDGLSNEGGNPIYVASQLKDMGVKVCVVGIGSINRAEIDGIASPGCAFYPTSFSTYVQAAEYALSKVNGTMSFTGINFGK